MNEKKFRLSKHGTKLLKNNRPLFNWVNDSDEIVDLLNQLNDENEQLKSQLYYDEEEGVCNICKHHYLVEDDESEFGYYNSRCKKGHYECARVSLKYCEDFEKELKIE